MITPDRRLFLKATASAFAALAASGCTLGQAGSRRNYGPLVPDPNGILDLPRGFSYRIVSRLGDAMDDGLTVPDYGDGMGCFALPDGKIALVRNHELMPQQDAGGTLTTGYDRFDGEQTLYDGTVIKGSFVLPGGTTTIVLDPDTLQVERQYRSLAGTIRNCAGGITPWGSWLTCEEFVISAGGPLGKAHGYVFEVPADAEGLVDPLPLKAMGRFNHEAACVDPASGIVYMTEDRDDSLFYRFIPNVRGRLAEGGRLQALAIGGSSADTRNWSSAGMSVGAWHDAEWVDIDRPDSLADDVRIQGRSNGAALFARGEGLWMGDGELYFCCTSGGAAKLGQIFRLQPGAGGQDRLQLFFESTSPDQFNYGDNLCVAPNGHLIVCEDQYTDPVDNHLRGINLLGEAYDFGRLHLQSELAGACFSPDGRTMFVNAFSPTTTFAITGPW
ncbi:MAG TPA: alkaline phosphatase PhoX [Sphingomonadaceae bacterium]|nr:alkaline phosphatase PhoX [Sphingomonadaceae bacterium]